MMLGLGDAVEVDANDLLSELTASEPTVPPPPETENGTPADHVHTIPHEQSVEFLDPHEPSTQFTEDPPSSQQMPTPQGDIFLENADGYQDATGRVSTLKVKS